MTSRRLISSVTVLACLTLTAAGLMALSPAPMLKATAVDDDNEQFHGVIAALELKENKFTLRMSEEKRMTVIVNAHTQYTLNGKESTRDQALQKDASATVTCRAKSPVAIKVDVQTE